MTDYSVTTNNEKAVAVITQYPIPNTQHLLFHIKPARPERERHPATTNIETPPITTLRREFLIKTPCPSDTTKNETRQPLAKS